MYGVDSIWCEGIGTYTLESVVNCLMLLRLGPAERRTVLVCVRSVCAWVRANAPRRRKAVIVSRYRVWCGAW